MTDQLSDERAEQAARAWLAQQASGVHPRTIDPAAVRRRALRRRRFRVAGVLAAAAAVVAAVVILPVVLRPSDPPLAGVPEPSTVTPAWKTIATPPLSPRFGSVTAWLDGQFYLVGGWDGEPCPPGSACDLARPQLHDGARYDPATDSWTTIAGAPVGMGVLASNRGYFSSAATAGVLYVANPSERLLWSYDAASDRWQRQRELPAEGELVATSSTLFLNSYDTIYAYGRHGWSPVPAGPLEGCAPAQVLPAGQRLGLLARCGDGEQGEQRIAFYSTEQGWSEPLPISGATQGSAAYAAGRLVWPGPLTPLSSFHSSGILDVATGGWTQVAVGGPQGGLLRAAGADDEANPLVLATAGLVEANGNLLNAATAQWVEVPPSPVPGRWEPVRVAGADSVLDCFGYLDDSGQQQPDTSAGACYLLTGLTASSPVSPLPKQTTTGGPAGSPTWTTTAAPTLGPRFGSLTAWLDGRYYLLGGWDGRLADGNNPGPCPPEGVCDLKHPNLRDGARYDPATDTWEAVAEAPFTLGREFATVAVQDHDLYVLGVGVDGADRFAVYRAEDDSWQQLATPPASGSLIAIGSRLVLDGGQSGRMVYQVAGDGWTPLPSDPLGSCAWQQGLAADGRLLVVGACPGESRDLRGSFLDLADRTWSEPFAITGPFATSAGDQDLAPVTAAAAVMAYTAGGLVWPDTLAVSSPVRTRGVYDPATGGWRQVAAGERSGGLAYPGRSDSSPLLVGVRLVLDGPGLVVANGDLLDVRTARWRQVPAAPVPDRWDPVLAAGQDSVLSCFGYRYDDQTHESGSFTDACYLLRPS